MSRIAGLRGGRSALVSYLAVLAIATGGTAPVNGAFGQGASAPAVIASDAAHTSFANRATARDAAWESRAAAARLTAAPDGVILDTSRGRRPAADARVAAPAAPPPTAELQAFRGTNHFWIPSLGMSYGVRGYACGRTSYPGNYMYRWGCAGRNNVYILGHAFSVMKPLHDLYVRGGLRKGLVALYADSAGRIRAYQVTEWRVVRPTEVAWQTASQPVPSMTLQTCIGKNSEYRLNVRLVAMN